MSMSLRDEHMTLKDIQRSAMYVSMPSKKPLTLHAVELPFQPTQIFDRGLCPFCVRFFDDMVREVGSVTVCVKNNGTVSDILQEAKNEMRFEFNVSKPLRVLEVTDSRIHKNYRLDVPVRNLLCYSKSNIFFHCLRVEMDRESGNASGHKLIEIFHCDRHSQQAFAQPIVMAVAPGERAGSIKSRCKAKLDVPDVEFKSWRLVRIARGSRVHLKDDESWDVDPFTETSLCLEHVHPNPINSIARQTRYNKPLTIK